MNAARPAHSSRVSDLSSAWHETAVARIDASRRSISGDEPGPSSAADFRRKNPCMPVALATDFRTARVDIWRFVGAAPPRFLANSAAVIGPGPALFARVLG